MQRKKKFGIVDNREVDLYTLTNPSGMEVSITNYGGTVTSVRIPLKDGGLHEVVLGFDRLEDYLKSVHYLGALVGRYANRIAKGCFCLGGRQYNLAQNNGPNHLHGGEQGFDKVIWEAELVKREKARGVQLSYQSVDGDQGYPGNLRVQVTYWLTDDNELLFDYQGETDAKTLICLTHHGYFNLSKDDTIEGHKLQIRADSYTPVDSVMIPTGELRCVKDTVCDLRSPQELGKILKAHKGQLLAGGFDHNFVLNADKSTPCATLFAKDTGLTMEMYTSEPGLQLYTGNYLDTNPSGVSKTFPKLAGLCLEAQHFPDSPNNSDFPSVVLKPEDIYRQTTRYQFFTS